MILELTDEQKRFQTSVQEFAAAAVAPRAAAIDESGEFPVDVIKAAAAVGLLGVTIPKAWGGLGLDYVSCSPSRLPIARLAAAQATLRQRSR